MSSFYDHPVGVLESDFVRLEYLLDAGPRIVRLYFKGLPWNFLAETPLICLDVPLGKLNLYGGHRLWIAPETSEFALVPDKEPPEIDQPDQYTCKLGAIDQPNGLKKSIEIRLSKSRAEIEIVHFVENFSEKEVELSIWPITQLPIGGVVYLPQRIDPVDPLGLGPNRNLVLWSYTSWDDPRIQIDNRWIKVDTSKDQRVMKIGYLNQDGWMGYLFNGYFFQKSFAPATGSCFPDLGSNVEVYANNQYVELESLSPMLRLAPGMTGEHKEVWKILNEEQFLEREALL